MGLSYYHAFAVLVFICAVCKGVEKGEIRAESSPSFRSFQRGFFVVYMLALAADWLQGPYVYALYAHYDFEKSDIAYLFIAGFGSSMVFGTIVGAFADKFGRKRNCILYGIIYVLGCLTKHYNDFWILMLGRVLAGIATSLLFSAFESWMVREHNKLGFKEEWLSATFSMCMFGNGLVAIVASLAANFVVETLQLGFVCPFDMAVVVLVTCTAIILCTWEENYGDEKIEFTRGLWNAWNAIFQDEKIMLLGLIQSLFEGTMYTFVFMWTPALEASGATSIPHGMVFACFMVAVMIGSALSSMLLSGKHAVPPESYMRWLFLVAAVSLAVPAFTTDETLLFVSFLFFEMVVGVFWPSIGRLRSLYLPEECRSSIMNIFRVPLNFMVVVILVKAGTVQNAAIFVTCSALLVVAAVAQHRLLGAVRAASARGKGVKGVVQVPARGSDVGIAGERAAPLSLHSRASSYDSIGDSMKFADV